MSTPMPASRAGTRRPMRVSTLLEPEPTTTPKPAARRKAWVVGALLTLILGVFGTRCVLTARADAITPDETTYLIHSLHFWMTGKDLAFWELGAPRLPHVIASSGSYLALRSAGMLPDHPSKASMTRLVISGAAKVHVPARLLAVGWGIALIGLVFWGVARRNGAWYGLMAAGLLSLVPEVMAHSAIAGCDMAFTASALLAIVLLTRYAERPSLNRWVGAALAIGLAWAMRHTALLLILLAVGVHLVVGWRTAGSLLDRLLSTARAGVGLALIAFLVLWAGDGFNTVTFGQLAERPNSSPRAPTHIGSLEISGVHVPASALSIVKQIRHQSWGHEGYYCGDYGTTGWPTYFPVAFLLKTPIGLLGLLVLAAALTRPRDAFTWICLAAMGLLWMTLVRNKVNIGVRYALLTYPLAIPFVVQMLRERRRDPVWGPLAILCVGGLAWASIGCQGRAVSYFNEIGGGSRQGWLYLADSNIDWGQDFDRLAPGLAELGIHEVTTDISSERRLAAPGLYAVYNPSKMAQVPAITPPNRRLYDSEGGYLPVYTRYVAVSVSRLLGLYSQNDMSWLRTRKLVTRVGDSVFVFDMDLPADRPLWE